MTLPQLGWSRPELIEAFISLALFQKWLVVSLWVSVAVVLVQPQPICSQKGESEISVLNFLPTTWRKMDVAVQKARLNRWKTDFSILSCLTADWVAVSHSVNFIHITNVVVIVHHYHVAISTWKSSCGRSWMLVSMQTSVWSIQLLVNCPWSLLKFPHDNPTTFNFFCQVIRKFWGGKVIVHLWPHPSIFLIRFYHSGMSGCQMLCHVFLSFPK